MVRRRRASLAVAVALVVVAAGLSGPPAERASAAPGDFTVAPTHLDFGDVEVGTLSPPLSVVITNVSATPQTPTFSGGGPTVPEFDGSTTCLMGGVSVTLDPGESCTYEYKFRPTSIGAFSYTTIQWPIMIDSETFPVTLTGNGVAPTVAPLGVSIAPFGVNFGEISVGETSQPIDVVVTNFTGQPRDFMVVASDPGSGFSVASSSCTGVLDHGQSCAVSYVFNPAVAGFQAVTSELNAFAFPFVLTLTGSGVEAAQTVPECSSSTTAPLSDDTTSTLAVDTTSTTVGDTTSTTSTTLPDDTTTTVVPEDTTTTVVPEDTTTTTSTALPDDTTTTTTTSTTTTVPALVDIPIPPGLFTTTTTTEPDVLHWAGRSGAVGFGQVEQVAPCTTPTTPSSTPTTPSSTPTTPSSTPSPMPTPTPSPPGGSTPAGALPATGSSTTTLAALATLLVLGGGAALTLVRRRASP